MYSYFDSSFGPTPGGAQRQQYLITKQLAEEGHSISFIVGSFGQPSKKIVDGITLIKGAPTTARGYSSMVKSMARLINSIKSTDPDILLVRGSPKLTAATYCCARILRKPLVFRVANDSDIDPEYLQSNYLTPVRRLYRRAIRGAAAVMTQTEQQQEALKEEFGVDSRVVTNAYDLPSKDELVPHGDRDRVLWVGSSDPDQKNPQRFLDLASDVPNERFAMVSKEMPNDDGYHSQLRQNAKDIDNLDFIGEVSPDEVHQYYKNAKLLVNTSDYEGFPNTFLEAWRYETPIVSLFFDLDGLLSSNEVGMFSGNMDQLACDVRRLRGENELRSRMGAAGRKLVNERYSISSVAKEYESVFELATES